MRIALIDNYDSFTFNVVHALGHEGSEIDVIRNDAMSAEALLARDYGAIVISPGPGTPDEAGITLELIATAAGNTPLLGICLGHQAIGQVFGGTVIRHTPMHGKVSTIRHAGKGLFEGINGDLRVARYHSLIIDAAHFPDTLTANAWSDDDTIMALEHKTLPIYGVQFHPESIATEHGAQICRNFLRLARAFHARHQAA